MAKTKLITVIDCPVCQATEAQFVFTRLKNRSKSIAGNVVFRL
jgi:hypothetical protein